MLRETQVDLFDEVSQRWALRFQIDLPYRPADQLVTRLVESEGALRSPPLFRLERIDGRRLAIDRDESIKRRATDSELQGEVFDIVPF